MSASVCVLTLSNMNISETNGWITTKFYLKHHWSGEKAALDFGLDRIRTLVSMATESSHRVIMEKTVSTFSQLFFIRSFSYLQVMITCMRTQRCLHFGLLRPLTAELAALERLKNSHRLIMGRTMSPLFLRSFSYLQVMIRYMRAWMSFKFGQIQPLFFR